MRRRRGFVFEKTNRHIKVAKAQKKDGLVRTWTLSWTDQSNNYFDITAEKLSLVSAHEYVHCKIPMYIRRHRTYS